MLTGYFQACGDAIRAAILGLAKPYLFTIPFTIILPRFMGEPGVWYASPVSEITMLAVTVIVLVLHGQKTGARFGLFMPLGKQKAR